MREFDYTNEPEKILTHEIVQIWCRKSIISYEKRNYINKVPMKYATILTNFL